MAYTFSAELLLSTREDVRKLYAQIDPRNSPEPLRKALIARMTKEISQYSDEVIVYLYGYFVNPPVFIDVGQELINLIKARYSQRKP